MKKIFSLLLVVAMVLGLSITANAAEDVTDVVVEVMEEDYAPFTGELGGSGDAALRLSYGFIWINDDGTFSYKVDTENEAVKKAIEGKYPLVDKCILTYDSIYGGWFGRYMNIVILPEGAKDPHFKSNFLLVTDMEGKTEGTILYKGEGSEEMALRVHLGRLSVDTNGEYEYVNYPFLECVQAMRANMTREDRYPAAVINGDATEEYHIVVRTTGENDKPVVKDHTYTIAETDGVIVGNVLDNAKQGDGFAADHKLVWENGNNLKYALSFVGNDDGTFCYTPILNMTNDETVTDTIFFTYSDIDGEKATGKLIINILPQATTPPPTDPPV